MHRCIALQAILQAAQAYASSPCSYTAAQQLLRHLQALKEAAEARPKVWLAHVTAHKATLPLLIAGLLQWKLVAAMETVLQLLSLLLPAPEAPKEGPKYDLYSCPALPFPPALSALPLPLHLACWFPCIGKCNHCTDLVHTSLCTQIAALSR